MGGGRSALSAASQILISTVGESLRSSTLNENRRYFLQKHLLTANLETSRRLDWRFRTGSGRTVPGVVLPLIAVLA